MDSGGHDTGLIAEKWMHSWRGWGTGVVARRDVGDTMHSFTPFTSYIVSWDSYHAFKPCTCIM